MEGARSAGGIRARFRSCEQEREIGERSVLGTAKKEAQSEVWAAGGDVRKMHNVLSAASCAPTGPLAKSRRSGHREGVVWRRSAQLARASLYIHTMVSSSRSKTAAAAAPLPRGGPAARLHHSTPAQVFVGQRSRGKMLELSRRVPHSRSTPRRGARSLSGSDLSD